MESFQPRHTKNNGPEEKIQNDVISFLEKRLWLVMVTSGNLYQYGFPDLYCAHEKYSTRWIEIKNPLGYHFTKAQMVFFTKLMNKKVGIWILTAATEIEYQKLWQPPNWTSFLGKNKCL